MAGRTNQKAPEHAMKPGGTSYGSLWESLLEELASFAPLPGAAELCRNLRPLRESTLVRQLQAQTREMQSLLKQQQIFEHLKLPPDKHWFKKLLQHSMPKQRLLIDFINTLHDLRYTLQIHQGKYPELWKMGREIQVDEVLYKAIQNPQRLGSLLTERLQKRQNWLENQQHLLNQFGLIVARAEYAEKHGGHWAHISPRQELKLKNWRPYRLDQIPPIELELNPELRVLILTGAHQTGKTRLLQSLYLEALRHQSGLPSNWSADSSMPIFSSLCFLSAQQTLPERLQALKPYLHQDSPRLLLVDGYLTQGSAGETYALGRAILEQWAKHQGLTLVASHDHLLTRQINSDHKSLRLLGLQRDNKRKQAALKLSWDQQESSDLKTQAQWAGWPSDILQKADTYLQDLTKNHTSLKKSTPTPTPPKKVQAVPKPSPLIPIQHNVPPGTTVYIPSLNQYGELRTRPNNRQEVEVFCQDKTIRLRADQVIVSSHRKEKKGDTTGISIQTWSVSSEECDLHGLTVDEALPLLEKFIDTAFHQSLNQVRIVHGKGTSTLRYAVHQRLNELDQNNHYIRSFRLGHPGEGDSGVTVVELK